MLVYLCRDLLRPDTCVFGHWVGKAVHLPRLEWISGSEAVAVPFTVQLYRRDARLAGLLLKLAVLRLCLARQASKPASGGERREIARQLLRYEVGVELGRLRYVPEMSCGCPDVDRQVGGARIPTASVSPSDLHQIIRPASRQAVSSDIAGVV